MAMIHPDLATPPRSAPRRNFTIGLLVAGVFHAGLLAWVAHQTFQPRPPEPIDTRGIIVTPYVPPPAPTEPTERTPRVSPIAAHRTTPPPTSIPTVPITPTDKPVIESVQPPVIADAKAPTTPDAPAATAPPPAPVIRPPALLRRPAAADLARFYPDRALRLEREGRTEIACTIAASGASDGCRLISETPADLGFGKAALALANTLRFTPKTVDGKPVAGGEVRLPLKWTLD